VLLPVEVKETVDEGDIAEFSRLVKYVGAEKGVIVSSSQEIKGEDVDVIPVYLVEFLLDRAKLR
jgi:hypothetical protein